MKASHSRNTRLTFAVLAVAVLFGLPGSLWAGGKKDVAANSAPAGKGKVVYTEDFEKGAGGWTGRGPEKVAASADAFQSGAKSLFVTGRTETWNGPIKEMSVVLQGGRTYSIELWAMYKEGPASQALNVSIMRTVDGVGQQFSTAGAERLSKGEWTHIEVTYTVPLTKYVTPISLYFETPYKSKDSVTDDDRISFYIDNVTVTQLPPAPPPKVETDIPTFASFYPNLTIGTAMTSANLDPKNIHYPLLRHFNAFVYGNEMKQDAMQPVEGKFVFEKADKLMAYASKNHAKVRGHVLVWHQQYPKWLFQSSSDGTKDATKEELLARMKTHIQTIVSRYRGQVDSWDVVNECIGEDGQLRNSKYLQIVGSDEYIASAFKWAHEADPDAKLFINDYNTEYSGAKQEGFYNEVKKLLDEGVPISGVGFQTHISVGRPAVSDIRAAIRRFADLGLLVQITELDISIYNSGNEPKRAADRDTLLEQAYKYKALFDMFEEERQLGHLDMVMIWGMSDDETWLDNHPTPGRTDYPLLFGKDLRAKPAYWIFADPEKLPIAIKRVDATQAAQAVSGADDTAWALVSPRDIANLKGEKFGWWKMLWTAERLYVLARVEDATKDDADGVTLFVEPKNLKQEKKSDAAITVTVSRAQAVSDDGKSYTVLIPIDVPGKLDSRIGFDIRVQDGTARHSWNDFTDAQDAASTNYGTVSFRKLPPVVTAKRGTPKVDGQIDSIWQDIEPTPMKLATQGFTKEGSQFRVMWDDQYVYVLSEVQDDVLNDKSINAYEQDSVEIFIDQNNAKSTIYEKDDAQYRVNFKNYVTFNGGNQSLFKSASRLVPGGYRVEFAIPITDVKAASGALMGFDVQINDADAGGTRSGIRNWVNASGMGYQDTSGFGLLKLE